MLNNSYFWQMLIATTIFGIVFMVSMIYFAWISFAEKEARAGGLFLLFTLLSGLLFVSLPQIFPDSVTFIFILSCLISLAMVSLFLPIDPYNCKTEMPKGKIDERDTMFSRKELEPGTQRFQEYYANHPKEKKKDDAFRAKPGLLDKTSHYYHPLAFAAAGAGFFAVSHFKQAIDGPVSKEKAAIDENELSIFIRKWARKLGAVDAGFCRMHDYHWYFVKGRGETYGKPVETKHQYGIALTVEMDKAMVDAAPGSPIVMESAQQYLDSGRIAVQLAAFLRNLGYAAKAHIDGNYEVVCPLVARDAGLGEIGRMGLLMTPKLGPRVRIAVVTTNAPLQISEQKPEKSVIHFCEICKKCAAICPSNAIPIEERKEIKGAKRWQIDSEACYTYWCIAGTDCGKCMRVCPYSHPDNLMHNIIRWGIRNSFLFRFFALKMDDLFYGRKPQRKRNKFIE